MKTMQKNWIGRSEGASIMFSLENSPHLDKLEVFTTRPDTIFGMSFCAISPNHPLAKALAKNNESIKLFLDECNSLSTDQASLEKLEKKGVKTAVEIKHPFKNINVPLYIANFVLMEYGTGAIFGCPAHDQRDLEFALKYNLDVFPVVCPLDQDAATFLVKEEAYTGHGKIINSDFLNGMSIEDAKEKVVSCLLYTSPSPRDNR